ncbi:MAG: PAS domain-containing protein, partial [Syntrophales bacterium]|nr:PAS domain-containing protein [Syntrophales bacterium]
MEKDIILDSIADGVFTVDDNWRITSFNRAAEQITGVRREDAIGQRCKDVLKADVCEKGCILRKTIQSGKSIVNRTVHIVDAEGRRLPISISTALLKDEQGRIVGAVETFRDISVEEQLRKAIAERYSFEDIISKNHRMHQLFDILPDVADSTSTVLLEGESGTGKELFARACLVSYDYPGNVRELQNIIEHAFILCKSGLIAPHHLPENLCLSR